MFKAQLKAVRATNILNLFDSNEAAMAMGLFRHSRATLTKIIPPVLLRERRNKSFLSNSVFGKERKYRIVPWLAGTGCAAIVLGLLKKNIQAEDGNKHDENTDAQNASKASQLSGTMETRDYTELMSNTHTSKWRVYTNEGKKLFSEGKFDEAEKYLISALEEAKEGFGVLDPHVASSYHNLAELYRTKRMFEKAEPLYTKAIEILELTVGPQDMRVGVALHNLGGFYVMQGMLDQAQPCFERALKIKRRILGLNNPDYANTMFHYGEVLRLQGNLNDAEVLINDSIKILEESKLARSELVLKRMGHLAQLLVDLNKLHDAESMHRKILHILELTKGWDNLTTVAAAEKLAVTAQNTGKIDEAIELLKRCLEIRRKNGEENNLQVGKTMLKLARALISNASKKLGHEDQEAQSELHTAKSLLDDVIRITEKDMQCSEERINSKGEMDDVGSKEDDFEYLHDVTLTMMQAFESLGPLESMTLKLKSPKLSVEEVFNVKATLEKCLSMTKRPGTPEKIVKSEAVQRQHLSCLYQITRLLDQTALKKDKKTKLELKRIRNEIRDIEAAIPRRNHSL